MAENEILDDLQIINEHIEDNFTEKKEPRIPVNTPADKRLANLRQNNEKVFEEKERLDVSEDVLIQEIQNESPYVWALDKRSLKGRPFDFDGEHLNQKRPFLIQPLEDMSPYKGFRKARQLGLSENCITEVLWFLDVHNHTKACYTLPSGRQVQDFSNTRIAPAIDESLYLQGKKGDIQNVNLKQIGDSFIFLRSGALERLGEGIDSDITFFDELDRMSPRIKIAFEESLQSSRWGWVRDISTPSVPNYGVDVGWEKSKQYFWYIKCGRCGKRQQLTWLPDDECNGKTSLAQNLLGQHIYVCKYCDKELTIDDRLSGEWVAKFPNREPSFYQLTQLMAPWISAQNLWDKQEDYPFKQLFFNYCLGVPYLGDNVLVTEANIMNCLSKDARLSYPVDDSYIGRVSVGVDWGDTSYVVVGTTHKNKPLIIGLYKIVHDDPDEHPKQVAQIISRYDADIAVCDAGYGKDRNSKLLKAFPEKIFSCFYPSTERGSKIFEPQWQDDQSKVNVDRTTSLKVGLGYFRQQEILVARNLDQKLFQQFVRHLTNLVLVKDIDEKDGTIEEWIANMGQDHFGHAYNYMVTGISKFDKLPKSEYWDGEKEIAQAIKEKRRTTATSAPEVPGFRGSEELIQRSVIKGILKGECYGLKYDETSELCYNCSQGKSCRDICGGGGGIL